jgi:5'-3' exonuclease
MKSYTIDKAMGIKGLFQFLKRFEKDVFISKMVQQQSVGVDLFWFLHSSKGDHSLLQECLLPIITNASHVHCVLDGPPSTKRKEELQKKEKKRKEILYTMEELESHPLLPSADNQIIERYRAQLQRQSWKPTHEFVEEVIQWIKGKGCMVHRAEEEADEYLIQLEKQGTIQCIITNDSDLLAMGSYSVIRCHGPNQGGWFSRDHLCADLGLTSMQWDDFMFLCRQMKEPDILLNYSFMRVYKELDYALQKMETIYHTTFLEESF